MATTQSDPRSTQLNLPTFVAPTTLLFLLIVIALASIMIRSPGPFGVFVAAAAVASLHDMLAEPRRLIHRFGMVPLEKRNLRLAETLLGLSASMGVSNLQPLWTDHHEVVEPFAIGTFRRHYIVLPESFIQEFDLTLEEMRGVLYHELAHIKAGDTWKANFPRKFAGVFLVVVLFVTVISPLYLLVWTAFDPLGFDHMWALALPTMKSALNYAVEGADPKSVFDSRHIGLLLSFPTVHATITNILGAGFFLLGARALIRVREFYADAAAATIQGTSSFLRQTFARITARHYQRIDRSLPLGLAGEIVLGRQGFRNLVGYHPPLGDRFRCLLDSTKVLGQLWAIPFLGGLVIGLMNKISLLQLQALSALDERLSMETPFVLGFVFLAVLNNDYVVRWQGSIGRVWGIQVLNVSLYTLSLLAVQYIWAIPVYYSLVIAPGILSDPFRVREVFLFTQIERAPILLGVLLPVILLVCLGIDATIKSGLLSSYSLTVVQRNGKVAFNLFSATVILLISVALWKGIYPAGYFLLWRGIFSLVHYQGVCRGLSFYPSRCDPDETFLFLATDGLWLFISLMLLSTLLLVRVLLWVVWSKCPVCKSRVAVKWETGFVCARCGQQLNDWFLTRY